MERLALFGGEKTVVDAPEALFKWPIITEEDEKRLQQDMADMQSYLDQKWKEEHSK